MGLALVIGGTIVAAAAFYVFVQFAHGMSR